MALMNGSLTAVVAVLGAIFGLGLVTIVYGAVRRPDGEERAGMGWRVMERLPASWTKRRVTAAVVTGIAIGALTAWPVAAVLTAAALLTLPGLLGPDRQAARRTERMEALANWTEMLRDTLSAAAGLEQAILATADIAPTALEQELGRLAASVRAGRPLPAALRAFAEEADDPLADVVVSALVMAAEQQGSQLGPLLGELAESVREQVAMRQRIDAGRASIRTGVRVTVTVTLGMAVGLVVFNRSYLDPFDTLAGQVVLAVVGALFATAFTWLTAIGRVDEPVRLISTANPHGPVGVGAAPGGTR
ncbi:type II secretion system F family protein [Streptomyces sp. ISL-22]|uniref:type II secretion system F family protein n=1 Tax=unclassified Streptomyces TaxID=2593676 RepID=UPI001BE6B397|nr:MULTISPECIES: type II secretion system F family protein [unclassified Streptomyces]MBT2418058.1 type II secretion system F family protein [Streptomyces sp. ISL-24]MBT2432267.1 type II secretion system F family protein [Streptomyces sp. ISL-22]